MMNVELLDQINRLSYRLECHSNLLFAMYDSMRHGSFAADAYAPGIYALCTAVETAGQDLRKLYEDNLPRV